LRAVAATRSTCFEVLLEGCCGRSLPIAGASIRQWHFYKLSSCNYLEERINPNGVAGDWPGNPEF